MLNQIDVLLHLERHKDLLREAEQARLEQLAISAQRVNKAKKKTIAPKNTAQSKSVEIPCCNPAEIVCCAS